MYTIREAAKLTGFSPDTLRYYEKIGLVQSPQRGAGEARLYGEEDIRLLESLHCLKQTGLSLEEIKEFIQEGRCFAGRAGEWSPDDIQTMSSRSGILAEHLTRMEKQRQELDNVIELTKQKLNYYNEILASVEKQEEAAT